MVNTQKTKKQTDTPVPASDEPDQRDGQAEEWKNKYLRALADYQNLERRVQQEKSELRATLEESLVIRLLPIVDVFDELARHDPYKKDLGLQSIRIQIHDVLKAYGVKHEPVVGTPFNPHIMECIEVREVGPDKDNEVLEELLKVYLFRDKLLRPAKVIVGKKKEGV